MIRKLIVAMVAAAMLVAMAVPAFAQNHLGLLNIGNFAELAQKCKQANVAIAHQEQSQSNTQNATGISQSGVGNVNFGDSAITQTSVQVQNQEANPVQINACVQALNQEFDLFGDERSNGPPDLAGS